METVRPHLSPEQYTSTQAAVADFLKSPLVKTLQERLTARSKEPGINSKSWLIEWWNDAAYMGYRDPVVVFVSYYYVHVTTLGEAWKEGDSSSRKAALLIKALLVFRKLVETYVCHLDRSGSILISFATGSNLLRTK
jgi:carnitine O-acetyltransferase